MGGADLDIEEIIDGNGGDFDERGEELGVDFGEVWWF